MIYRAYKRMGIYCNREEWQVCNAVIKQAGKTLYIILYIKKLQAIHLMLYKRWCKTAKIKKYKHEHYALA